MLLGRKMRVPSMWSGSCKADIYGVTALWFLLHACFLSSEGQDNDMTVHYYTDI